MSGLQEEFAKTPGVTAIRAATLRMWLISALGKGGGQLIQLVALLVLARVLVPEDFGMVAMAMVFIGVADIFRDFGLSAATVRAQSLNAGQASAMFFINVGLGCFVMLLIDGAAPLVSQLYGEPLLTDIIHSLSWIFLFNGLSAQHQALLRRQLKFGLLAWVNLLSMGFSQILAIVLALKGLGYWSLVWAAVLAASVRVVLIGFMNPWLPGKPVFDANTRAMLRFGTNLAVFGFIGFVANNAHSVIIGERYGAEEVAFYNRAFVLLSLALSYIMSPLATVVPAALSRVLVQPGEYKELYLHYVGMMLSMTAPIGFLMALLAGEIVEIVLGEQWLTSVLILQLLALSVVPRTLAATSGWLYQSHGDSRRMMIWGVGGWSFLLVLLIFGAQHGIVGVAIAYSIGMFLLVYPCMLFAFRKTQLNFKDLLPVVLPIIGAALLALPIAILAWWLLQEFFPLWRLMSVVVLYGISYLSLLITVFGKRKTVMEILKQLRPSSLS